MKRTILSTLAAAALTFSLVSTALADDDGADDPKPPTTGQQATDHADPATKTLPSHASATAKANAFGQKGAAERAAHAAAKAAAVNAANQAGASNPGADNAAKGKAHAQGPASQAQRGLATAAAARAAHQPTSHPGR